MATLKWDGLAFAAGTVVGIFLFGETVSSFDSFWSSSYMGRLTLPDLLPVSTGVVVFGVVVMAVLAFAAAEQAERVLGDPDQPSPPRARYLGALLVLAVGLGVVWLGQPTVSDRWDVVAAEKQPLLDDRAVQIHPGELLDLMENDRINLVMFDVRDESDYNLFHIADVTRSTSEQLSHSAAELLTEPGDTVVVLMGNGEAEATDAWRALIAQDVPNVYILDGGINHWLDVFGHEGHEDCTTEEVQGEDQLRHVFGAALGSDVEAAEPDSHEADLDYVPKVKLQQKKPVGSGGCG